MAAGERGKPMSSTDEKLSSLAGEAGVLGSMILDKNVIPKVLQILPGGNLFYEPEHQRIFDALVALYEAGKPIDAVLLRDALEKSGQLEKVGGVAYIAKILDSVPSSANAEHYAGIVKDRAKRRRLITAVEGMQRISELDEPVGESVFQIQQIAAGLDGAVEGNGDSQPIIKSLADVEPLPIHWFWFNKIPLGMVTLIEGDPGLGKSFLALYMAAKVSTGGAWPDGDSMPDNSAPTGSVIILTAEDDLSHVVRPRLDAMGADVSKIIAIEGVRARDENNRQYEGYFNLQQDLPALRQVVKSQKDVKLIIIDPLLAYLGGNIDSNKDSDVRSMLRPLIELAEQSGVAVVGVRHLNKSGSSKAIYRGMGSIAFTAAARTVWLLSTDPDNPESKRRLLTPAKHNILIEPTGLAFELNNGRVIFENEPVTMSSDEALGSIVEAPELDKAVTWLKEILPPGCSLSTVEVTRQAKENGITESTLRRAKNKLGVVSYPLTQPDGKRIWLLRIPEDALNKDDTQQ